MPNFPTLATHWLAALGVVFVLIGAMLQAIQSLAAYDRILKASGLSDLLEGAIQLPAALDKALLGPKLRVGVRMNPLRPVVWASWPLLTNSVNVLRLTWRFYSNLQAIRKEGGKSAEDLTQALTVGGIWTIILFGSTLLLAAAVGQLLVDYWLH